MKNRFILLLLVPIVFSSCIGGMFSQRQLRKGKEAVSAKDFDNAYLWFDKAARKNKKLGEAYYLRGLISESRNNKDAALRDYQHAFENSENRSLSGLAAGKLLWEMGKYKECLPYLERSYADDSSNHRTGYFLMLSLIANSKAEDALLLFDRFTEAGTNGKLNYAKALASDSLGIYDYAGVFYRNSIDLDKSNPAAYIDYTRLLLKTGNDLAALDVASEGVKLFNNQEIMKMRMSVYASKYQWHSAISEATTLYNLTKNMEFIERRARYYQFLGLLNNARSDYSFILSLDPNNTNALFNRAIVNMRLNNEDAVFTDINKFLKLETPNTPTWQSNRAKEILSLLGKEIPPPSVSITEPALYQKQFLGYKEKSDSILIKGTYVENAKMTSLTINDINAKTHVFSERIKMFSQIIPFPKDDTIRIAAIDMYENIREVAYPLIPYEDKAPEIMIFYPQVDTSGLAKVERKGRFFSIKVFTADKNFISEVSINESVFYKGMNKRTFLLDTLVPIPADNKIRLAVKDIFDNISTREFTIDYSENKLQNEVAIRDVLVLFFEGKTTDSLKSADIRQIFEKTANVDLRVMESTSKKSVERYLMFELPHVVSESKYKDVIVWFCGQGVEEPEASYWWPTDANSSNKQTWFNLSFLSSITKIIHLRGTLVYITGNTFLPKRLIDTRGNNQNTQAFVFKNNSQQTDSLSVPYILEKAFEIGQKVDFIQTLEQLSAEHPESFRTGWLKEHYRNHSMPVILFWK
jgi:tetratricopeptide (TPR) repeat protein